MNDVNEYLPPIDKIKQALILLDSVDEILHNNINTVSWTLQGLSLYDDITITLYRINPNTINITLNDVVSVCYNDNGEHRIVVDSEILNERYGSISNFDSEIFYQFVTYYINPDVIEQTLIANQYNSWHEFLLSGSTLLQCEILH